MLHTGRVKTTVCFVLSLFSRFSRILLHFMLLLWCIMSEVIQSSMDDFTLLQDNYYWIQRVQMAFLVICTQAKGNTYFSFSSRGSSCRASFCVVSSVPAPASFVARTCLCTPTGCGTGCCCRDNRRRGTRDTGVSRDRSTTVGSCPGTDRCLSPVCISLGMQARWWIRKWLKNSVKHCSLHVYSGTSVCSHLTIKVTVALVPNYFM